MNLSKEILKKRYNVSYNILYIYYKKFKLLRIVCLEVFQICIFAESANFLKFLNLNIDSS